MKCFTTSQGSVEEPAWYFLANTSQVFYKLKLPTWILVKKEGKRWIHSPGESQADRLLLCFECLQISVVPSLYDLERKWISWIDLLSLGEKPLPLVFFTLLDYSWQWLGRFSVCIVAQFLLVPLTANRNSSFSRNLRFLAKPGLQRSWSRHWKRVASFPLITGVVVLLLVLFVFEFLWSP